MSDAAAVVIALLVCSPPLAAETDSDWVEQSNANAQPALEVFAKYSPESAGSYGLDGYDEQILDLSENVRDRSRADIRRVLDSLKERLNDELHPKARQDLEILIQVLTDNLDRGERRWRLLLPYIDVAQIVFESTRGLLDDNVDASRYPAAVIRLEKYAGLAPDTVPLTELAKRRTTERCDVDGLTGPYRLRIRKSLAKSNTLVNGIAELMRDRGLTGWESAHEKFAAQVKLYNEWIEAELLPRGRDDHQLPAELYLDRLQAWGIRTTPEELIERGQFGFIEIRNEMAAMAKHIAARRGWNENGYRDVIAALKREQLEINEILPVYRQRLREIEDIIRRERILTLPDREARIRFATAAESAVRSAPSMQSPRLIGNTGEYGAFLIPLRNPNAETSDKMDDFLHDSISWSLTAHEARPGHEMQFSSMIENGVSITRAVFAWNSANTEGWGLYSEAIMKEHLPLEGQFFTLYMRLLRAARAFLDPMVNLGQMEPSEAKDFLMDELLLSEPMATQEVDRYSFRLPGQAPSYYYGLMKLQALRAKAELQLKKRFDQQSFHDFILAQGLLPLELLEKAVLEEFVPEALTRDDQSEIEDQNETDDSDLERVKKTLSREIDRMRNETGIPSIAIALLKDDSVVWSQAFGHLNVQLKIPASPDTIYSTGSCFKPITAMAVMQLVDAGKLKLDDPINNYLGEHSVEDKTAKGMPVTVRHLLSHYSGLVTAPEAARGGVGAEVTSLWHRTPTKPLTELPSLLTTINDPGQTFRYSNYGYSLAGLIVEKVSEQSFDDYVVDNIYKPLGIDERPVVPTPEMIERLALPYRLENNRPVAEHWRRLDVYPAGDTWMSVPAMATVLLTHLNNGRHNDVRILSEESVVEMRRPQFGGNSGLDFGIREHDGSTLIMHGGGVPGYATKFLLDVDSNVGVYVAVNAHLQLVTTRLLAQMSIDLLRGKELGQGLVREVTGIGVMFGKNQSDQWQVDGVVPGSSANREGLKRGLVIQAINDVPIADKSLRECLQMIKGPAGTRVRLKIIDSAETTRTVELTKQKFLAPG